jgi:hypothetical protein
MGPIEYKFISSWQLCTLKTGQSDKTLKDLRNSKGSRELSTMSMKILVSGVSFEFCVFTLYVIVLAQGTRFSNVTASLLPQLTLFADATVNCRLVAPLLNAAFRQSVPSQILFSITFGFVAS